VTRVFYNAFVWKCTCASTVLECSCCRIHRYEAAPIRLVPLSNSLFSGLTNTLQGGWQDSVPVEAFSDFGVYRVSLYPLCHTLTDSPLPLTPPPLFQHRPLQLITLLTHSLSMIILKHSEMTSISTGLFLSLRPHFLRRFPLSVFKRMSLNISPPPLTSS
jgi:hypothetical protein